MKLISLLLLPLAYSKITSNFAGEYAIRSDTEPAQCHMTPAYPPDPKREIQFFEIDLDKDPQDRWTEPVTMYKDGINAMLDIVLDFIDKTPVGAYIRNNINEYMTRLPKDWAGEIEGISTILDRGKTSLEDAFLFNIAYEIFGLCTSIIAQDENGHVYHGRNLDFGLWPNVNWTDVQWTLTTDLREILFNANFTKSGEPLYQSVVFGGYIGLLTGVRKGAMSISVDSRFDDNYDKFLMEWLKNPDDTSQWLAFVTREAIEDYTSYSDAVSFIKKQSFIGPCYVIIGGDGMNEGSVLSIGPNMTLFDQWEIENALPQGNSAQPEFYVLETNYDHWEEPPRYDDRRYPAEKCMDEIGSKGMDWYTIYNVLNGIPNRNRLTTYTALMDVSEGKLTSYKQYCTEKECIPW